MSRSTRPLLIVVILAIVALAAACTPSSGALGTPATPPATSAPSVDVPSAEPTPDASTPAPTAEPSSPVPSATASPLKPTTAPSAGTTIVRAYFFVVRDGREGLVPVLREVPETVAVATAAMRQLIAGPTLKEMDADPALSSAIPEGTKLLGIRIDAGIATVDLSREFESGGGSAAVFGRLAQVVYTLTQFSSVDGVRFELDGKPVTTFSGEGVILEDPVGRDDYRDQLPAIFVDRPAWGAALGNPGRVSGLANVFEATFRVQLRDASGVTIADEQVMASCGTGCWGTWSVQLRYDLAKAQWGTLRVFDLSAKDGSVENLAEYPVWLTRAG